MILAFIGQTLAGLGSGFNTVGSLALISCHYKDQREQVIGMIETSMMMGCLLGPILGAGLYSIGGYIGPFYSFATAIFVLYIFLVIPMLRELDKKEEILK